MRACGNMRPWCWSLLPGHAATDGFQLQAGVLRGFHRAAHGLTHKRWYFDPALLDV